MKRTYLFLLIVIFLASCTPVATQAPTLTITPTVTQTPTAAPTNTPTITPTKMPEAISPQNASQLVRYAIFGHGITETLNAVTSPDQKTIAIGSTIGVILYDTETLEKIKIIETNGSVYSVSFSPDGTKLAIRLFIVVQKDRYAEAVEIWDIQTGTRLNRFDIPEWSGRVIFSPDGCQLFNWDDSIHNICDNIISVKSAQDWRNPSAVISPDGTKALIYVPLDGWALWDTQKNIKIRNISIKASLDFDGERYYGGLPVYSPDGKTVASFQADQIYLFDGAEIRPIAQYKINSVVRSLYYSPDSKLLLAVDMTNKLHLLAVATGEQLGESEALPYLPMTVAFSPDNEFVTTLDDYINIYKWKIPELKLEKTYTDYPLSSPGKFSNDGKYLAIAAGGGYSKVSNKHFPSKIVVFDANTLEQVYLLEGGHDNRIGDLAFSTDNKVLASADSITGIVNLWNMDTGELTRTLEITPGKRFKEMELKGTLWGVAFSDDGTMVAAVTPFANQLYLWDASSGELIDGYGLPFWRDQQMFSSSVYFNKDGSQAIINNVAWDLKKKKWLDEIPSGGSANASKNLYIYDLGCVKNNDWENRSIDEFCVSTNNDWGNSAEGERFSGKSYSSYYSGRGEFIFNQEVTILMQVSGAGVVILWHIKP